MSGMVGRVWGVSFRLFSFGDFLFLPGEERKLWCLAAGIADRPETGKQYIGYDCHR